MNALEVTSLNKKFDSVIAASDINITINTGEIVSIIGSNGAGKTTFLNMVTGYIKPDSGSIKLFGKNITGWPPRKIIKSGIGRSFQIPQLFDGLTTWENMVSAVVLSNSKLQSLRYAENLEVHYTCNQIMSALGISNLKDAYTENLPGGNRKLLDIGMAVVAQPRLLLLDEPTSGISEQEKMDIMEATLKATKRQDMATILVEHDMEIVNRFSDRVIAFVSGKVIADGSPEQVLNNPLVRSSITG